MNTRETRRSRLTAIVDHIKDRSFKAFIAWKGETCTVNDLELFESIVISTLMPDATLSTFFAVLNELRIRHSFPSETVLQIFFPARPKQKLVQPISTNPILRHIDEIEIRQERLYHAIVRVKEKMERAIKINRQIKIEFRKSEEFQLKFLNMHFANTEGGKSMAYSSNLIG
jgi:hypothetical protein